MTKKEKKYLKGWQTAKEHEHYFDGFNSLCNKATQDDIGGKGCYQDDWHLTLYTVCGNCKRVLRKIDGRSLSLLKLKK